MKTCIECKKDLELSFFNKNKSRCDNLQNICKACNKLYRSNNSEKYNKDPIAAYIYHKEYMTTDKGKQIQRLSSIKSNIKYPNAHKSRNLYSYAIKTGALVRPATCQMCHCSSDSIQGHHCDYNKPLEVMWLCIKCHSSWHKMYTPLNRGSKAADNE